MHPCASSAISWYWGERLQVQANEKIPALFHAAFKTRERAVKNAQIMLQMKFASILPPYMKCLEIKDDPTTSSSPIIPSQKYVVQVLSLHREVDEPTESTSTVNIGVLIEHRT